MKLNKKIILLIPFSLLIAMVACKGGGTTPGHHQEGVMSSGSREKLPEQQKSDTLKLHKQHLSLANNFAHKDIVILDNPYQLSEATKAEMEQVIDAYLKIKDALVKEDEEETNIATELMAEKIAAVSPESLEGKGLEAWQSHQALYEAKLKEMRHITGLENKRSYFSHISEILYCTIKSFGLKQGKLFAIFCPMAFDNKGAYWISDSKVIQNPYTEPKMPPCGEIMEEL